MFCVAQAFRLGEVAVAITANRALIKTPAVFWRGQQAATTEIKTLEQYRIGSSNAVICR
jgi:hypothetical protein